jgi:hypothetical protein
MGCRIASTNTNDPVHTMLNQAWHEFWQAPAQSPAKERKLIEDLKGKCCDTREVSKVWIGKISTIPRSSLTEIGFERPDWIDATGRPPGLMTRQSAGDVSAAPYLRGASLIADDDLSGELANTQL